MNQKYKNYYAGVSEEIMDYFFAKYGSNLKQYNNCAGVIIRVFVKQPYYHNVVANYNDILGKWEYYINDSWHFEKESLKMIKLMAFL